MVLGGDLDRARREILHGLVHAAVAELELVRLSADGEGEELVAETNPEERALSEQSLHGVDGVGHGRGIAWAVRYEDAVGGEIEDLRGGGPGGDHGDAAAGVDQAT